MCKTVTFAVLHFGIAFTITYLLTGDVVVGGLVALVEPAVNTLAFYFHEKVWRRIEAKRNQGPGQQLPA
ncbi:DUF2061 domain-containing protein [Bowmanella pacifica]|uniref:Membrane protein n=1 Tax=Bowmanella pacifica TaxID=502051 RepID=A0A917Z202_9ALTE|nr:DUF2061 domain-containing protein [Bowmanella pacifica]GGO70766.1 membrane protein [Bowmanella pacifica]